MIEDLFYGTAGVAIGVAACILAILALYAAIGMFAVGTSAVLNAADKQVKKGRPITDSWLVIIVMVAFMVLLRHMF
jgi:divalent metal cation (Fe/Co/Zn/Cd) transporter